MIALAASMYDLTGMGGDAAALGDALFFAVGCVVTALLFYGFRKQRS